MISTGVQKIFKDLTVSSAEADLDTSSDGHDKPFCIKAIKIINNFKNALGNTDKSQFLEAISVIDELLSINFSDKCCGKFSMCLTKSFFLQVNSQKCFSRFFKKRELFTGSAVGLLNPRKRDFFNCNKTLSTP